ncbi:hypothetical protein HYW46_01525 [Candidatus Daviesbacteria bacterium]|nr:hypothetical protein [Candidatus Daviesbacteria bacterium]
MERRRRVDGLKEVIAGGKVLASGNMLWAYKTWGDKSLVMEPEIKVKKWFGELFNRYPFTEDAVAYFRTLNMEAGDLSRNLGGGYWYADKKLVQIHGAQDEAAIHELSHAFWEPRRNKSAKDLMAAVVGLSKDTDPCYHVPSYLAKLYINGDPNQQDPNSPTGYWRGMLVEGNDTEMYAGLSSGIMGDIKKLPPYVKLFYQELFNEKLS